MKRTAEITLSIIGAITALFGVIIFGALRSVILTDDFVNSFSVEFNAEMSAEGIESIDAASFLDGSSVFLNIIVIVFVIALILATIAAILFRKNNKPKTAGIILIIAAIIVTVGSLGSGIITGILLLIAGIMGLVRKPKIDDLLDDSFEDTNIIIEE